MVSVQEIKKQDTTTILADIVGLSTDEKPTTLGGKSVANGSTFVEMNTSDIYLYDQQNEEWKKFSGGSGGGGGGDNSFIKFDVTLDENHAFVLDYTPQDIYDALNQNKYMCFALEQDIPEDGLHYREDYVFSVLASETESEETTYTLEITKVNLYSNKSGTLSLQFKSTGLNETFTLNRTG